MRIVHVVSALSPDNRFGGPSRVALDLCEELQQRGEQVVLFAAGVGYRALPRKVAEVRTELRLGINPLPFLGWAGLMAPGLQNRLRRRLRDADVLHVHLARDLVTIRAALLARRMGVPYVLQTHGMIDAPSSPLAGLLDALATRRVVRGAAEILTLTADEDAQISTFTSQVKVLRTPNGVARRPEQAQQPHAPVLFLARLHPRKGAADFAHAALVLSHRHPSTRFAIVGPDEGDGALVRRIVQGRAAVEVVGALPPEEARRCLESCLFYVLPAEREPFGMTVIEAMSGGRPVVLSASSKLAPVVVAAGAGWTFGTGGTHATLEEAMEHALTHADERDAAGRAASELVETRFALAGVVDMLQQVYRRAVA